MKNLLRRCLDKLQTIQGSRTAAIGSHAVYIPQMNRYGVDSLVDDLVDALQQPNAVDVQQLAEEIQEMCQYGASVSDIIQKLQHATD